MERAIAGVLMGGVTMFMVTFLMFPAVYLGLEPDLAFEPNSFQPTQVWIASNILVALIATGVGGYMCASISQSSGPPVILALLVAVFDLILVAIFVQQADPGFRTDDVTKLNALMSAKRPLWALLVNPVVGAVGVLFGAKLRRPETPALFTIRKFA
jgi:hypothetical protein